MAGRLRLEWELGFSADTSRLLKALSDVHKQLEQLSRPQTSRVLTHEIEDAAKAADELKIHLENATNVNTGKLDLSKLAESLGRSNISLEQYGAKLRQMGPEGERAFLSVANAIAQAEMPLRRTNEVMDRLWVTMKNTMRWQLTSSMLHGFMGALNTAFGYSKSLNASLNNIRIVTGKSTELMADFAKQANKAAQALSVTTTDYTDATLIYYQQGLTDLQAAERAAVTAKMANVSRQSAEDVSQQLTSIWNNFNEGGKTLEFYADAIAKLGAETATSSEEIATGVQKFSAVAGTIGLSYEYATGALATITAKTRESADTVGTSLRTIFARLQGLNLGETLDDGTTLNKYSKALAAVGVNIKDLNGALREADDILNDLGARWQTLAKDQLVALALTVAGVRQYATLIALMDNWNFMEENVQRVRDSEGTLEEQARIYSESWEAARDRVTGAVENIYDSLINPEAFILADNVLTPFLNGIADLVDIFGGLPGLLTQVGSLMMAAYGPQMAESVRNIAYNARQMMGIERQRAIELKEQSARGIEDIAWSRGDDVILANRARITKEMVGFLIELDEKTKNFTSFLRQLLELEVLLVNFAKERALAYQDLLAAAEKQLEAARLLADTEANFVQPEKYNTDIPVYKVNAKVAKGEILRNVDREDLREWLKSNEYNGKYLADIDNYLKNGNVELKGKSKEILTKLQNAYLEDVYTRPLRELSQAALREYNFREQVLRRTGIIGENDNYSQLNNSNYRRIQGTFLESTKELSNIAAIRGEMESLRLVINDSNSDENSITKAKERLEIKREELKVLGYITKNENGEDTFNLLKYKELGENQRALSGILRDNYSISDATMLKIVEHAIEVGINTQSAAAAQEVLNQGLEEAKLKIELVNKNSRDWALTFIDISDGLMQAANLLGNIDRAAEWFSNESASALTKLTSGLMILGSVGLSTSRILSMPLVAPAIGGITTAINTLGTSYKVFGFLAEATTAQVTLGLSLIIVAIIGIIGKIKAWNQEQKEASQRALESYEEEKQKLDELNSKLETTKNRIEELKAMESLSIVELEELLKLERENDLLEELLEILKELEKIELKKLLKTQKEKLDTDYSSVENFAKSEIYTKYNKEYELTLFNDMMDLVIATGSEQEIRDYIIRTNGEIANEEGFKRQFDALELARSEYSLKVREELLLILNLYNLIVLAFNENKIEEEEYNEYYEAYAKKLGEYRKAAYKDSYISKVLDPILQQVELDKDNVLANNGRAYADKFSDKLNKVLRDQGIGVQEFADEINSRINVLVDQLGKIGLTREIITNLLNNGTSLSTILTFDFEGIDSFYDFVDLLYKIDKSKITVTFDFEAAKSAGLEGLTLLGDGQELSDELKQQIQTAFDGIYDLSNFDNLSRLDLARELTAAYVKTFEVTESDLATVKLSWDKLLSELDKTNERLKNAEGGASRRGSAGKAYFDLVDKKVLLEADTTKAEKQYEKLKEQLDKDPITLRFELEDGVIASIRAQTTAITNALDTLKDSYELTSDDISTIMENMPELFKAATVDAKTGVVSIQEDMLHELLEQQKEIMAQQLETNEGNLKDELLARIEWEKEQIASIGRVKDAAISNSGESMQQQIADNEDLEKDARDSVKAIIAAKLLEYIAKTSLSDQAASNAIDNENQIAKAAEVLGNRFVQNWTQALKNFSDNIFTAFSAASQYGQKLANNEPIDLAIVTPFKEGFSGRGGNSTYSAAHGIVESPFKDLSKWISNDFRLDSYEDDLSGGLISQRIAEQLSTVWGMEFTDADIYSGINGITDKYFGTASTSKILADLNTADNDKTHELGEWILAYQTLTDWEEALKGSGLGGKEKSGGGGSKTLKELKEIVERYHEIQREIKYYERLLERIEDTESRAYGAHKLELYRQELEEINKLLILQDLYISAAKVNLAADYGKLQDYGLALDVDPVTHEIRNYTLLQEQLRLDYNQKLLVAAEEDRERIEKEYDERIKALEQYEKTLDTYYDEVDKYQDLLRKQQETLLKDISTTLEVKIDLKDAYKSVQDFGKKIADAFGDSLTKYIQPDTGEIITSGFNSLAYAGNAAAAEIGIMKDYEEQYNRLVEILNTNPPFDSEEEIINQIKEIRDNAISSGESILSFLNELENAYPNAIQDASKRFIFYIDQLNHNTKILDTIKQIFDLQAVGNNVLEKYGKLDDAYRAKYDAQLATGALQRQYMEVMLANLADMEQELAQYNEYDTEYDTLKKARDALLAEYNKAQEEMLASAQQTMETAKVIYQNAIEEASKILENALTKNDGFDFLQQKYDNFIDTEERYFDAVNTIYEQEKYNDKIQSAIDDTTNKAQQEKLKALNDEFALRTKNNRLSQYDVDIMNAKYEMTLKQMALEDALNAKSKVRLVRNASGNYTYLFTSDQDEIDKAEDDLRNAQQEYYNIAKKGAKDTAAEIINTRREMQEKLTEVYQNEELNEIQRAERILEIHDYYGQKLKDLEEEKQLAIADMTEAGSLVIEDFGNTYGEVIDNMTEDIEDFEEIFNDAIDSMEEAALEYQDLIENVNDLVGTSYDELAETIDDVTDSTDRMREAGELAVDSIASGLSDIADARDAYLELADAMMQAVYAARELAEESVNEQRNAANNYYDYDSHYAALMAAYVENGGSIGDETYRALDKQRKLKVKDQLERGIEATYYGSAEMLSYINDAAWRAKAIATLDTDWEKEIRRLLGNAARFATGGYTGDFGENARLALLDSKELVLNSSDTENILAAVQSVRELSGLWTSIRGVLDGMVNAGMNLLSSMLGKPRGVDESTEKIVQQKVEVNATFPGVTSAVEIENALNSIVNEAAQYASIKKL